MDTLVLHIYDYVGPWEEVRAKDVVATLNAHAWVDAIDVRINSYGGVVAEGLTIYNALLQHRARVTTTVEGVAASIASVILQAGDERVMAQTAQLMIHDPMVDAWGTVEELEAAVQQLENWRQTIAGVYAQRSGTDDVASFLALMAAETWFTAEQAVGSGLADVVRQLSAAPVNRTRPDRPARLGFRLQAPATRGLVPVNMAPSAPTPSPDPNPTPAPMADQTPTGFAARIRAMLGIRATDDFEALDEARQLATNAARVPELEQQLATAQQERQAALDEAAALRQRIEALEAAEDERLVEQAVAEFRIPAAQADKYRKDLATDRAGTRKLLESLPENLHRPGGTTAPAAPDKTKQAENVEISREDARDARKYRAARAQAREKGVRLVITD